jgi:hypothetical protein
VLALRRRRTRARAVAIALTLSTASAFADPPEIDMSAPATPPSTVAPNVETPSAVEAPADAPPKKLVGLHAGLFYTDTHVTAAESGNFLALGWFPKNDFTIYAGFGASYNPNGAAKDSLGLSGKMSNKLGADLVLAAGYFVIDNPKHNLFMGPELVWVTNIAPESFDDVSVVELAWAIRYGLWHTPVAIGTDLGVTFTSAYGVKGPMIATAPFGLHIVYSFN